MASLNQGNILIDYENDDEEGEPFVGPLICELDDDHPNGRLPTFYMSPAIIGTKKFHKDLLEIGIDNIEVHPVVIRDEVNDRNIKKYVLLNIIGTVSCADMNRSKHETLGEGMDIIDKLVIDASKVPDLDLFLIQEDTDCIVISEKVYNHLQGKGYDDIHFEELEQV